MGLSNTERIARALMAHYHPELKQTWNERPNWLRNPETGKNLELDIQFKDIQSAIEVSGIQHGRPIDGLQAKYELVPQTFWQRLWGEKSKRRIVEGSAKAGFDKQLRHDAWKIQRCQEWGVKLYRLTIFDLTEAKFLSFLKRFEEDNRLLPNRYLSRPADLFAEAERLSRQKFRPAPQQDSILSVWQKMWKWLKD
jgi:hypothetical protein